MTHPLSNTIDVMIPIFETAVVSLGADVLDWRAEDYAGNLAIVIGECRSIVSRDRFATPTRLPMAETWEIDIDIYPSVEMYSRAESRSLVLTVFDELMTAVAQDETLGAVASLKRTQTLRHVIVPTNQGLVGTVVIECQYRIDRRVS